jgi:hypothetical protein
MYIVALFSTAVFMNVDALDKGASQSYKKIVDWSSRGEDCVRAGLRPLTRRPVWATLSEINSTDQLAALGGWQGPAEKFSLFLRRWFTLLRMSVGSNRLYTVLDGISQGLSLSVLISSVLGPFNSKSVFAQAMKSPTYEPGFLDMSSMDFSVS